MAASAGGYVTVRVTTRGDGPHGQPDIETLPPTVGRGTLTFSQLREHAAARQQQRGRRTGNLQLYVRGKPLDPARLKETVRGRDDVRRAWGCRWQIGLD